MWLSMINKAWRYANSAQRKTNAINGLITQLHEQTAQGMPLRLYAGDWFCCNCVGMAAKVFPFGTPDGTSSIRS